MGNMKSKSIVVLSLGKIVCCNVCQWLTDNCRAAWNLLRLKGKAQAEEMNRSM